MTSATATVRITTAFALLLAVGCGETEPVLLPTNAVEIRAETIESEASTEVLDMRATVPDAAGEVAGAQAASNPPLTSSSIAAPAPPPTLTGPDPTTSITRPPTIPASGSEPPPTAAGTTPASAVPSTAVTAPAPAPTTTPTTAPAPAAPTTRQAVDTTIVTEAPAGVVEFRIPAGTQAGAWNSFDAPVRISVGQTLRIPQR